MTARAGGLRRFVDRTGEPPPRPETERCDMCATPLDDRHGHVVDAEQQRLMCTCRACYLLFARPGQAGRYHAVPDRCLHDPADVITGAEWDALQVPVGTAFFIGGLGDGQVAGFYPSPAGATECLLDLDAWARLHAAHPLLAEAEPRVESILARRTDDGVEYYLAPVDACYELVGAIRVLWQGFDGGAEARAWIDEFFGGLAARAVAFTPSKSGVDHG